MLKVLQSVFGDGFSHIVATFHSFELLVWCIISSHLTDGVPPTTNKCTSQVTLYYEKGVEHNVSRSVPTIFYVRYGQQLFYTCSSFLFGLMSILVRSGLNFLLGYHRSDTIKKDKECCLAISLLNCARIHIFHCFFNLLMRSIDHLMLKYVRKN